MNTTNKQNNQDRLKFKAEYQIDHIDKNDNYNMKYRKSLGIYEANTIETVISKLHKIYNGDIDYTPKDSTFASIILHYQELPNGNKIETVINIHELNELKELRS